MFPGRRQRQSRSTETKTELETERVLREARERILR